MTLTGAWTEIQGDYEVLKRSHCISCLLHLLTNENSGVRDVCRLVIDHLLTSSGPWVPFPALQNENSNTSAYRYNLESLEEIKELDSLLFLIHIMCLYVLFRHMKIHEKDPNSATTAAPPSPLKRRRLSSKRKLSHDAESEREDPAPAKKVLSAPGTDRPQCRAFSKNTSNLYFCSMGTWQASTLGFLTCVFPHCFYKGLRKEHLYVFPLLAPLAEPRSEMRNFHTFYVCRQANRKALLALGPSPFSFGGQCSADVKHPLSTVEGTKDGGAVGRQYVECILLSEA